MKLHRTLLVCPLLLTLACNEGKDFGGDVASGAAPVKSENQTPAEDVVESPSVPAGEGTIETKVPDASCKADDVKITKVKLLSTGLDLSKTDHVMKYEISMVNCKDGSRVPIKNEAIWFDLDLIVERGGVPSVDYVVAEAQTAKDIAQGKLRSVSGSDMFGKKGNYFHWETDSLSYTAGVDTLTIEISIEDVKFTEMKAGDQEVLTYLRIGDSTPAVQAIDRLDK